LSVTNPTLGGVEHERGKDLPVFGKSDSGLSPPSQVACDTAVPPTSSLLSPALLQALAELAEVEDLPLSALIAILINEALGYRLHQRSRS